MLSGRRKGRLDETIQTLEALNKGSTKFLVVQTDVSKAAETDHLFARVTKAFGRAADVVFANAGVGPAPRPLAEEDVTTWWKTFVSRSSMPSFEPLD